MLADSHAHIDFPQFDTDREEIISRSWTAGIRTIVIPGTGAKSSRAACEISEKNPHIWFTVGWHPSEANDYDKEFLLKYLDHPKCVGIGEIGLDFYRDYTPRDLQEKVFRAQLDIALEKKRPVIIHIRDAWDKARIVLDDYRGLRAVLHSFSGGLEELNWALEKGYFIGLGGPVTYDNFKRQDIVEAVPIRNLLLETDCPYLAPQDFRGKRNEPSFVAFTAVKIADIKKISIEKIENETWDNSGRFFGIPMPKSSAFWGAKEFLSQNFLIDDNILTKIASLAEPGKLCIEIGAGHGEMTQFLADNFEYFFGIEPDWDAIPTLKNENPKIVIVPRMAQDVDISGICRYIGNDAIVAGNLPYGDTSPILFHLLEHRNCITKIVVTVQKEFGERLTSHPGTKKYGIPTVLLGLFFDVKHEFDISPESFRPIPRVVSSVLTLTRKQISDTDNIPLAQLKKVVKGAFAHRRKTIYNSLLSSFPGDVLASALQEVNLPKIIRAEDVEKEKFVELSVALEKDYKA
jgi:TatD DNase family protein